MQYTGELGQYFRHQVRRVRQHSTAPAIRSGCDAPLVFGRIEGEVRALDLQINDGAQVEGNIIAQNVTVCGRVKGTIRAVRVRLQNGGAVEGDIFHRSLSIDETSQFEGSSRRVENPTEPSSIDAKDPQKGPQKKDMAPAPLPPSTAS